VTGSPNIATPSVTSDLDASRRMGDWTIYKYYARALGSWGLIGFVTLIVTNGTFSGMGSKFNVL